MKPSAGRHACDCCRDLSNQEFQKIVELKEAGVAIYRYVPQIQDEKLIDPEAEEIFVLRNIGDEDLKLEDFIVELGKTNISCPRCVKMVEHAGKLLSKMPKVNIREVSGVCDHCYMRQRLHCPCCKQIVDKFLTFCTNEAQKREEHRQQVKSWLTKTQMLLKKTFLNVQGKLIESRARSEDRIRDRSPNITSGDQSRILTARSIPTTKHLFNPSPFLRRAKEMTVKDESKRFKKKNEDEQETIDTPLKIAAFLDYAKDFKLMKTTKPSSFLKIAKEIAVKDESEESNKKKKVEQVKATNVLDLSEEHEPTKTTKYYSFLKVAKEIDVKDESEGLKKKKIAEEDTTSLKLTNFFDFSEKLEPAKTTKSSSFLDIAQEMKVNGENKRLKKKKITEEGITETPLKVATFLDFSQELEPVQTKAKLKTMSLQKSHEGDGVPQDIITPSGERKRYGSPSKSYSFDTVIKSPSEADVSVFSYTFPQEKIVTKKPIKGRVSSSELIKNTQQMLQERAEAEKKIREEELKKRREEDERKKIERDKRRKIYTEKKTLEEKLDKEKKRSIEITKFIKESSILFPPVKANSSQSLTAGTIKHESKSLIRKEAESKVPGPKQTKVIIKKPVIKEEIPAEVKPDVMEWLEKNENLVHEIKAPEQQIKVEKQHDIPVSEDLKHHIVKKGKEDLQQEKETKKQEKLKEVGEKKPKAPEKKIEEKQQLITTEKKIKSVESKPEKSDGTDKPEKIPVIVKESERKAKGENKHDIAATTDLKQQLAKQAKAESAEEKNNKKQEKYRDPGEKKVSQAERIIQQPVTMKQIMVDSEPEIEISREKVKEPEQKPKEIQQNAKEADPKAKESDQKAKEDKQHDIAAATILREQLAGLKKAEIDAEKNRKQQEMEREMIEKKSKEVEKAKLIDINESAIKPTSLKPEYDVSLLSDDINEIVTKPDEVADIIIGDKVCQSEICDKKCEHGQAKLTSKQSEKVKHITGHKSEDQTQYAKQKSGYASKLFSEDYHEQAKVTPEPLKFEQLLEKPKNGAPLEHPKPPAVKTDMKTKLPPETEASKGVIRYALSDCTFIDKGWTMLPTEKVVRKMNVYRMRPAKPEFDWFEHHKYKRAMTYDTGELLAEFGDNGRGRWYYRNGKLALDYYDAEEINAGQRFVVYSSGEPDERGRSRPRTVLATFDYLGNGIVFDHSGKIRLKYNQTEGVVLDRAIGPPSHWKWHTLNDPPILQQVMIDTQMPYKDPRILKMGDKNTVEIKRPDNEEMLAIEFENFLKEKSQKLTQSFKPFQIRMKAMKINENFSLRVMDQASVYLLFRDGTTNLKMNIGMILDHKEIVDTDTAEIGEVSNTLDKLPACTDSIAGLQRAVARAQAHERLRVRHESRLKRTRLSNSVDELRAHCSHPLRPPLLPCSSDTLNTKTTTSRFKPSCSNLYYNTQLY